MVVVESDLRRALGAEEARHEARCRAKFAIMLESGRLVTRVNVVRYNSSLHDHARAVRRSRASSLGESWVSD